jgi:hypothetical protein
MRFAGYMSGLKLLLAAQQLRKELRRLSASIPNGQGYDGAAHADEWASWFDEARSVVVFVGGEPRCSAGRLWLVYCTEGDWGIVGMVARRQS